MHCQNGQLARFVILRPQRMDRRTGPPVPAALASWWRSSSGSNGPPVSGSWRSTGATDQPVSREHPDNQGNDDHTQQQANNSDCISGHRRQFNSDNDAGVRSITEAYRHLSATPDQSEHTLANATNSLMSSGRGNLFTSAAAWLPVLPVFSCGHPPCSPPLTASGNIFHNNHQSRPIVQTSFCKHYIAVPGMDQKEVGRADEGGARSAPRQSSSSHKKLKTSDDVLTKINELRQWEYTSAGKARLGKSASDVEFSIMSYNVLAQCLLEDNGYLYTHCDERALSWNQRSNQLLREFQQANADILCLQEVQWDHYDDFYVPELGKLGYVGLFKKRTGNKLDGCAIFYKQRKFVCDSMRAVEFCHPEMGSDLARDNIALLATLRPRSEVRRQGGRNSFCVANTHLLFNPGRGDIKLAQLRILLAEIDRTAFLPSSALGPQGYRPILMCGDMNSEPQSPLHQFVCTGQLSYEGLTAGDVSGQVGGVHKGRFQLKRELLPPVLGISDQCQYVNLLEIRQSADSLQSTARTSADNAVAVPVFSSGSMSHSFNLVSAYNHVLNRLDGQSEVTTHHRKSSCTVDYIFYSVDEKDSSLRNKKIVHKDVKEGDLTLLATYGLLGASELERFGGLPNQYQPSDHLPLIAKFLLRTGVR